MATIRKRSTSKGTKSQIQIRKKGHQPISKSFASYKDARTFARETESRIERSVFESGVDAESILFGELAERYLVEVLIHKKGYDKQRYNIRPIIRFLKDYKLISVRPHMVSAYMKYRLSQVSPATVRRELGLISRILVAVERDFGTYLPQGNPVTKIKKPEETGRERRPSNEELKLLEADKTIGYYVTFAVETGMRRGEIANIKEEHLSGEFKNLLYIPETKTDLSRTIPLSRRAREALKELLYMQQNGCGKIAAESVSQAFSRACMRNGIEGLRFHDLRHEATSRVFEKGLNIMEV